jgi:16S rRNA (cytosine967-C5)-methyltransferase
VAAVKYVRRSMDSPSAAADEPNKPSTRQTPKPAPGRPTKTSQRRPALDRAAKARAADKPHHAGKPTSLLNVVQQLLQQALKFEQPTDSLLGQHFREHRGLGSRERHLVGDVIFQVIRELASMKQIARAVDGAGTIHFEKRLALLAWPPATRDALGLDDATQSWLLQAEAAAANADRSSWPVDAQQNLPWWLVNDFQRALVGQGRPDPKATEEAPTTNIISDDFKRLMQSFDQAAPLDLRVNALKAKRADVLAALHAAGIDAAATPYAPTGIRVVGKPSLSHLPVMQDGWVEVQDEGSQLLAALVDAKRGEMVADFCAGGGGKTLALGAAMRNSGRLYALDTSAARLAALMPRAKRAGLSNIYTMTLGDEQDARLERLAGKLDRVLVDAPCSGLGTLRRSPDLKWRYQPRDLTALARQQTAILAAAARLLKPGGRLVYATCSPLHAENEAIVEAFEASHPGFARVDAAAVLQSAKVAAPETLVSQGCLRLWPHRHGTDGFFAAVLTRQT